MNEHDVYIFDMGNPIKLLDVINQMQDLLGTKSLIVETGLRPGEKLHEDLVFNDEVLQDTGEYRIKGASINLSDEYINYIYELVVDLETSKLIDLLTRKELLR